MVSLVSAQEYVEAIARELSRLRGRGLLLSPSDSALALAWHGAGVPLSRVLAVLREQGPRLLPSKKGVQKGPGRSAAPQLSLQVFASTLSRKVKPASQPIGSLSAELWRAAQWPELPARALWETLAAQADDLLAGDPEAQHHYWSLAVSALLASLLELGRKAALEAGAALRERLPRRPPSMARARYRRSLQLHLLSASSARLGVPPAAFLL